MQHSLEIIFLQAQPGAFLKVYRQAAEGQHLPVIVIGKRGDADVVVLRDDQHITRLGLVGYQVYLMRSLSASDKNNSTQLYVLWRMEQIGRRRMLQGLQGMKDGDVFGYINLAAHTGLLEQERRAEKACFSAHFTGDFCKDTSKS